MVKEIIAQWDANKDKLEDWFKATRQEVYSSYEAIVTKVVELLLTGFDKDRVTEIDYGDYQGTLMYVIGANGYQPDAEECLTTYVYYGSCSGCDTLQSISDYEDGFPNEEQVKDYMLLALNIIQNMKYFNKGD